MSISVMASHLTDAQFDTLSTLVKRVAGINLHDGKKELVKSRLNKRLRSLNLNSFDEYIDYLAADKSAVEMTAMLDAISTNLTSFFRENSHFEFLADTELPRIVAQAAHGGRRIRIWSAGCSSGEEPYTIMMCLMENLPDASRWDVKLLATDLSTQVLSRAKQGLYTEERVASIPLALRSRYFRPVRHGSETLYQVNDDIRRKITFARVNLMDDWPMRGPFDVIFCRNVMIYFDKPTQERLVNRYWDLLAPDGLLFIGHSESLTGVKHRFRYVQPTVYQRP